jgi:hypothetical protein
MPVKLSTTIKNIASIPNPTNAILVRDFSEYMKSNGLSEHYQNGNLKIMIYFAKHMGPDIDFYSISKKEQILIFLNTRIKNTEADPDKRWIRTWNDYLQRIKYFFRWIVNDKQRQNKGQEILPNSEWITPPFVQIKERRTNRLSPYLGSELWERDEILVIIKYEPNMRNKRDVTFQDFHYSTKIGSAKYWIIVSIPLVFFLGQFQSLFIDVFQEFRIANPFIFGIIFSFVFNSTNSVGGILFGLAFLTISRNIHTKSIRDYMQISAIGMTLLFTSNHAAIGIGSGPYPPFALGAIWFVGISSYLLLVVFLL